MAGHEAPRQHDMFTGETVDPRTASQKRRDKERQQPQQAEMFSAREIAQFGVNAHPQLPLSLNTRLELSIIDHRSDEEIEEDRMRAAEALTYPLFDSKEEDAASASPVFLAMIGLLAQLQIALTADSTVDAERHTPKRTRHLGSASNFTTMSIDGVRVLYPY